MDIRYKLYPYPVLSAYTDDYINSSFDTVIQPERDGFGLKISFLSELVNTELSQLLKAGKINYVYHLECAQTGYRTAVVAAASETVHTVSNKQLNGRLQVCPFIVARESLADYVNADFHPDYRGFKFAIEAGCVMAVGKQTNIDIENEVSALANTPSVFKIIRNADEAVQVMQVDMGQKKIIIKLPDREFFNYKSMRNAQIIQPVLNSLIVLPALAYVLEQIARREPAERYEYSTHAWYRVIKRVLGERFGCDIESEQFSEQNILTLAQRMIDIPLGDALKTLASGYGNIGEEDDE